MSNSLYPATSPYYLSFIENDKYLGLMVNRSIPRLSSDPQILLTQKYEYRPDILSYELYNTGKLWWVFAQRNPDILPDPVFSFVSGITIYTPRYAVLQELLGI